MQSVSMIGIGRLGGALAIALSRAGYNVENVLYRKPMNSDLVASRIEPRPKILDQSQISEIASEIVFIATADPDIAGVDRSLSEHLNSFPIVYHTSGSLSSDILANLKSRGCPTGSFHPLISVSDPIAGASVFAGAYFCLEGDESAIENAVRIVGALGGESFTVEMELKPLYHASAVMASGHLVALFDAAITMLHACGLNREQAKEVLLPLVRSTIENLSRQSVEAALTGSFARGDIEAFERHRRSFPGRVPFEIEELFYSLGERSLELAERHGADPEKISRFRERISVAKRLPR